MSGTSENWRRTSRSCIMIVRRDKWKKSDSQTCRYDGQIYSHWYKILGLLYKRALFDLQFVHNLFWLKLKWIARSKLFYCIYRSSMLWWSSRTLGIKNGGWVDGSLKNSSAIIAVFFMFYEVLMQKVFGKIIAYIMC